MGGIIDNRGGGIGDVIQFYWAHTVRDLKQISACMCSTSMATGIGSSAIGCVLTESDSLQDLCGERVRECREQIYKLR